MALDIENEQDRQLVADAFNEWMDLYQRDPAQFEAQFNTVADFRRDQANGAEPSYGQNCAAFLFSLIDEGRQQKLLPDEEKTSAPLRPEF